jgi:hypothetical protein
MFYTPIDHSLCYGFFLYTLANCEEPIGSDMDMKSIRLNLRFSLRTGKVIFFKFRILPISTEDRVTMVSTATRYRLDGLDIEPR